MQLDQTKVKEKMNKDFEFRALNVRLSSQSCSFHKAQYALCTHFTLDWEKIVCDCLFMQIDQQKATAIFAHATTLHKTKEVNS